MLFRKRLTATLTAVAVAMPVTTAPVWAGADDVLGGIVGGIIGGAIVNQQRSQPRRTTRTRSTRQTRSRPAISSAQRQQNRDVQVALNHFGFDAGGADGVLGRRSRTAISGMQAFLALPADGTLTTFERDVLLTAHARAVSGNPDVLQLISGSPMGSRAVLRDQYARMTGGTVTASAVPRAYPGLPVEVSAAVDEIAASSDPSAEQLLQRSGFIQLADLNGDGRNDYILDTALSGSTYWCGASDCQVLVFASTADGYTRNNLLAYAPTPATFECVGATCRLAPDGGTTAVATAPVVPTAPQATAPAASATGPGAAGTVAAALPSFGAAPIPAPTPVKASLGDHCDKVTLLTTARGGPITDAGAGEPAMALAEQFCLARAHAILETQDRLTGLGLAPEQAAAQCDAFKPVMADQVARLATGDMDAVMGAVTQVVLGAGLTPDQLRTTASICLGSGYRTDDLDVAMGAALLMVALGSAPHAELIGHHVAQGFGTAPGPDRAAPWYGRAVDALKGGAAPVFAADQPGRTDLLVWAVGQGDQAATTPVGNATVQAVLPSFGAPAD